MAFLKGNANKKLLLELNCLPRLLKLISSENRMIRRNSTLVLGSMSKYCEYCCLLNSLDALFLCMVIFCQDIHCHMYHFHLDLCHTGTFQFVLVLCKGFSLSSYFSILKLLLAVLSCNYFVMSCSFCCKNTEDNGCDTCHCQATGT